MATLTKIKYSQLENRFDSEYYIPEYLDVENAIEDYPTKKSIGELAEIIVNGTEIREYVPKGVPYLRVSDARAIFLNLSDVKYVRENVEVKKDIELDLNDLLFSRSGTIGVVGIVTEDIKGGIISSHLIRVKLKSINPYFAVVFFNSKYGRLQILRRNNGTVVPEINQPALKSIVVPIPPLSFQEHIEKLVKEVQEKRKLAEQRYKEAEQLLYKELGIEKLELTREKTFETTFSEVEKTMRFDPECYKPDYIESERVLKNINAVPLSSVASPSKDRFNPNNAPTQYFSYIDISNVDIRTGEVELQKIRCYEAPTRARKKVELDDVIISTVRPNRNAVAVIEEILDRCVCSTGFSVIKPEKINPYCLFLFLKTEYAINQLVKKTTASMYPAVSEGDIFNLLVPIPSEAVQRDVEKMIRESFEIGKGAKDLLDQTKTEVEELIEEGR